MNPQDIYKTEVKIDKTLPDLGLGHSFLQRKMAMDGIEQFNSDSNSNSNSSSSDKMNRNILLFVLIILIGIWLYRRYNK